MNKAINEICPWSGKAVNSSALTQYKGHVVGFCNEGCRDKFEKAINAFEKSINQLGASNRNTLSKN